jgi:APA family basic amino acid/polyamine antiporter
MQRRSRSAAAKSAFSVLIYYALTNLAALRMPTPERRYPRSVAAIGLVACLGLAVWIDRGVLVAGAMLIAAGLGWHAVTRGGATRSSRER